MKRIAFLLSIVVAMPLWSAPTIIPLESGTPEEIIAAMDEAVSRKDTSQVVINSLIEALESNDRDIKIRERAAWALGQLEAQSAVPALIQAAHHKGLLIRGAALNALIRLRPRSAFSVFSTIAQNDPVLALRQRATIALGLLQWDKAVAPLVALSSDEREEIRGASVLAMTGLHGTKNDFSKVFGEMSGDISPYVQERAKFAMLVAQRKNEPIQAYLLTDDSDFRLFAAVYYQNKGSQNDLKPLEDALDQEASDEVRYQLNVTIKSVRKKIADAKAKKDALPTVKPALSPTKPTTKTTKPPKSTKPIKKAPPKPTLGNK